MDRLTETLLRLLDRKKKNENVPAVVKPEEPGRSAERTVRPVKKPRVSRFSRVVNGEGKRDIRLLAELPLQEIIKVAHRKGRKLSLDEARIVKEAAGDHAVDDVEILMYSHGFFSS